MGNVLDPSKQQQVVALGRLGWSLRRIEQTTGVRRETVGDYLRAAGVPVRGRGRPRADAPAAPSEATAKPAISSPGVSTDSPPSRAPSASACATYRDLIDEALGRGRNARAIWQDLVDDHGFTAGYASVRRFVRHVRGASTPEARVVIVTAAGEEAQVDYGDGPMVRPPGGGKLRRTRLFVLTLGCSRKAVYLLTWQSSAQIWATLHEQAFRRLGGAPRVLVLDNLREGILTPDVYDPTINPLYRDVLAHYGVTALPCRVRDPDRKGKVERSVGHAKQTPLKGQRFESLEAAQAYLDRWTTHWADTRIHGTTVLHAQLVRQWSDDVIYFAHTQEPSAEEAAELEARGIGVVHGEVARLVVEDDRLTGLELVDGRVVHRAAVFVRPTNVPHPDDLLRSLGCALDDAGFAIVDRTGRTSVDGLWGCGQRRRPPRPGHHVRRGRLGRRDRHQRRSRSGRHRPGRLGRRLNMTVPARLADTATATDSTSPIGNAGCVTGSQPVRTGRSCRQGTCTSPRRCSPRRTGTMPAAGPGRSDSRTGIRTRCRPHTRRRSIE